MTKTEKKPFEIFPPCSLDGLNCGNNQNPTYTQSLFFPVHKKQDYHKDKIFYGWKYGDDDETYLKDDEIPFYLSVKNSEASLAIGKRGSGKTWISRADGSRAFKSGYACIYLTDIKGEMGTNNEPLQTKHHHLLNENEKPEAIPTISLLPVFMEKLYTHQKIPIDQRFQFTFSDLSEADWITLLHPNSELQIDIVKTIANAVLEKKITNFEEMRDFLDNSEYEQRSTKSLLLTIQLVEKNKVLGDSYPIEFSTLLDDNIVAINLTNYERLDSTCGYPQIYVAIILRKLIELRRSRQLKKPINVYIDEAHAFCPNIGNPSSKKAIEEIINVHRQLGFAVRLYTQVPDQLPKRSVLTQITHFFLPHGVSMRILLDIVKEIGWWEFSDVHTSKWSRITKVTKEHCWMYIKSDDAGRREVKHIRIAAPLCAHKEEKRF